MVQVPLPCALDDGIDLLELWLPAEVLSRLLAGGDEAGWVAGTPGFFHDRDLPTTYATATVDDFANARAAAGTEVELRASFSVEILYREDVRLREVEDVDVVADARAVRGLVVYTVDVHM